MGQLSHIKNNIDSLVKETGTVHFIETGTGKGNSLKFALGYGFDTYVSIDIWKPAVESARSKFPNCSIYEGHSLDVLKNILPNYPQDEPIFFWLDAHFPGAFTGNQKKSSDASDEIVFPLIKEIEYISQQRTKGIDLILCDDLCIIEDHEQFRGLMNTNLPTWNHPGIGFVENNLGHSHKIKRIMKDTGYLLLIPRGQNG